MSCSKHPPHETSCISPHASASSPEDAFQPPFPFPNQPQRFLWSRIRHACREPFSEFCGTMILVLFGDGVVAQVTLSRGQKGDYQSISWGWGLGVMLGILTSTPSNSHLNPAITFTHCLLRHLPWRKLPLYALSQTLGAMAAAFIVYGNYKSAIDVYEGGTGVRTVPGFSEHATGGIFCTYPAAFMTRTGMFFSEFVASALLMFLVFAVSNDTSTDRGEDRAQGRNDSSMSVKAGLVPLSLFFVVFGIGACFGWETGYAINLARDFGPRLVSYMLGYGSEVWTAGGYYFWIPIVAPFLGCAFGGWLYDVFLYTGTDSPVNTPWMGLRTILRPGWRDE